VDESGGKGLARVSSRVHEGYPKHLAVNQCRAEKGDGEDAARGSSRHRAVMGYGSYSAAVAESGETDRQA